MDGKISYKINKQLSLILSKIIKIRSKGRSYPGYFYIKLSSLEGINYLTKKLNLGTLIITGTNGKTTTTTLTIKLFENDMEITKSVENNTINAITTALLHSKGELGVFEYGIRNKKYGIPEVVHKQLDPKCILYTNVSREHVQVVGVKNPYEEYVDAKYYLSKNMEEGVIAVNADNPSTAFIGFKNLNRAKKDNLDLHINFYGFEIGGSKLSIENDIYCPICGKLLEYDRCFVGDSGFYHCDCGFSRPQPNIKVTDIKVIDKISIVHFEGSLYNWQIKDYVTIDLDLNLPLFGLHNIYNVLASITAYLSFTPNPENANKTIIEVCDGLDFSILPPGRFEVMNIKDKLIAAGQGDNGNSFSANTQLMKSYAKGRLEFIYSTPDEYEDEIFEDHFKVIRSINPSHVICVPGRTSVSKAEEYYGIIKKEFDAEFYPLPIENLENRINKIVELAVNSDYDHVIITGCGDEERMWDVIKNKLKAL